MKMKTAIIFFVILSILSSSQKTKAQSVNSILTPEYLGNESAFDRITASIIEPIFKNSEINPHALRNFSKHYKNISNVSWFKTDEGYNARFIADDINTIALFNKKGNWIASLEVFLEDKMPRDIRHLVKGKYYDYKIDYVKVIKTVELRNIETYFVGLEDQNEYKILRIQPDEMIEWNKYYKTK